METENQRRKLFSCLIHLLHDQLANFNFAKLIAIELYARKIKLFPK